MTQHILKSLLSSSYAAYRYIDKFRIKAIMQRSPSLNNPPSRITVNNQNHEASIYYMQYFYNKSKPVAFKMSHKEQHFLFFFSFKKVCFKERAWILLTTTKNAANYQSSQPPALVDGGREGKISHKKITSLNNPLDC